MRLEVAVFGGGVKPSEEGNLPGVEVGFTPRGDVAPSSAFSGGDFRSSLRAFWERVITAVAAAAAPGSGSSHPGQADQDPLDRGPGCCEILSSQPEGPHQALEAAGPVERAAGRVGGEGWREFEKFPGGPDFLPYPHPGRGLSLGIAREEAQAEEGGGRPVRKTPGPAALSWNLIYVKCIKSNTFCVHFR